MTYNRFATALAIQDACNINAVARELVKVLDDARVNGLTGIDLVSDAAVILLVNKLDSMVNYSADHFSRAYNVAVENSH